jgi:hypothetical protein
MRAIISSHVWLPYAKISVTFINTVLHCKGGQCQTKNFMIEEHRHIGRKIGDKRQKDPRKAKQYQFTRSDWF